jgi:hypothetical protein
MGRLDYRARASALVLRRSRAAGAGSRADITFAVSMGLAACTNNDI